MYRSWIIDGRSRTGFEASSRWGGLRNNVSRPKSSVREAEAAFSLIELLVVIAVISLLAGLLLPALGRSKGVATSICCKSNLKQQGLAMALYLADYTAYPGYNFEPTGVNFVLGWLLALQQYSGSRLP